MKIFIFERVAELTNQYHRYGGLVVIANNLQECLGIARNHEYSDGYLEGEHTIKLTQEEISKVITYDLDPSKEYEEKVFIFPDAGCC